MDKINKITKGQFKTHVDFKVGDTVRVHQRIKEGEKERTQIFEGLVIAKKHGKGISGTFTVRKVTSGVGVEKIFPVHMPAIEKIEIVKSGKVRQSKIYYIREATGRKGKLKEIKRKVKEVAEEESDEAEEIEEAVEETKEEKQDDVKAEEEKKEEVKEEKTEDKEEEKKEEKKEEEEKK